MGRINAAAVGDVLTEQFGYDATHNITAAAWSGDGGPRRWQYRGTLLVDDGRSHYTYDRVGRLVRTVTRRRGRKPEVWHYRWDAYDRLRAVSTPDGQSWAYGYDPANRRTHKTNTTIGDTLTFSWLGDQLIEQTAADGETLTWSYAQGALTPLAQVQTTRCVDVPRRVGATSSAPTRASAQPEIDRAFYALVTDHLGTPTHLIDPATATVAAHATTSLWGHTTWTGQASTPLCFPGQYLDPETGWHYNRHGN
ncbi:hypothetical protein [Mycobacterium camsae]|uniref:hypothetical protein n=1 Tax=Mycobacterium gordonae TaxID=1778 RepID=UPI00197FF787|nr:hypothetical protein [Mycobacterium gordonae]